MHNPEGKPRLFGTDGIRGIANLELTPELAVRVGCAAVRVLARDNSRPFLVVGRDTRISGSMLESALVAGICSGGGRVGLLGVVPTPAVAFLTAHKGADAGVVISASHNPARDNGIKFFHRSGYKLPDELELEMECLVDATEHGDRPNGDAVGCVQPASDAEEAYLEHLLSVVSPDLSGLSAVLDCAHGAAYRVAPMLLERLGARVTVLNAEPDGLNINLQCGSTHTEQLQRVVLDTGADLGLAFDGDADRLLAVDERGRLVDGDFIMAICALHMRDKGTLKGRAMVTTVMTNLGFHHAMRREGIAVRVTRVGDRYVLERMLEEGLNLGGEQSGHIIFGDHATTGDGLLTSLKLMEVMVESGRALSDLSGVMERIPQVLINVRVRDKEAAGRSPVIAEALRDCEEKLAGEGRVLVRPSGTEPVVRVMVEALDPQQAEEAARTLSELIEREAR
ncbi:MAG: phosphoglucosamine mutase [Actinomycetota bacterium]|nr:phosphoglucosamine mutase [Actinomycetota bacterium]MDD5668188.1 phosphoglucosamine mutase [Actinomycetota bacterium]